MSPKPSTRWSEPWASSYLARMLVAVILGVRRNDPRAVAYAVGAYITAAYWVHGIDVVRQPRGDAGPLLVRHVRRHTAGRRSRIPCRSTVGRCCRGGILRMATSARTRRRKGRNVSPGNRMSRPRTDSALLLSENSAYSIFAEVSTVHESSSPLPIASGRRSRCTLPLTPLSTSWS